MLLLGLIECSHMTSRWPYWCAKTMKRRTCWCHRTNPGGVKLFSYANAFFCSNTRGTILEIRQSLSLESTLTGLRTFLVTE